MNMQTASTGFCVGGEIRKTDTSVPPASVGGSIGLPTPPAHAGGTDKSFISNTGLAKYKIR